MKFVNSLTGRFLVLTVIFVMLAEVLIFLPSVARFRVDYLQERLELSQLASLALLATPDEMVATELEAELLENAEVLNVVLRRDALRELILSSPMPAMVDETYDLRDTQPLTLIGDAIGTMLRSDDRVIRVIGVPVKGGGVLIEITLHERPLRNAMLAYGWNILLLSLAISVFTALFLFLAARRFIVVPIARVVGSMASYRDDPEDVSRIITPVSRVTELREAEVALADLQTRLTQSLKQKERLAALGGAVSRISHDLRNMLTTAQLLADRMERSDDPAVRRTAPKLLGSLDRAINLCEGTLAYGKAEEPEPRIRSMRLAPLVRDVLEADGLRASEEKVQLTADIPEELALSADPEQLYRVLMNLVRNARQAILGAGKPGEIAILARATATQCEIEVRDSGPGLPPKALENIFKPFRGGARRGGTGLGLAIAAELVRGHGGTLELVETSEKGTRFRIRLPIRKAGQAA
ncbi:HAMP domain-containing histidine kinase [Halovulum dunhuangense]|uniref:histidine kinase n=2 Tax=Halovulum dunhuangense TaxID=1505036 RepID=A0A849L0R7_9RHOB|nr:HAMP domain-containing histidine kinase [Halovulum dunhuangense]